MKAKQVERLADIFAMVTFSFAFGMFVELAIAGLTLGQSLLSRCAAIPLNILTARLFGVYRDWLMAKFGGETALWRKALLDLIAFISFQIPIYVSVLLVSGASWSQISVAVSSVVVLFLLMGPPYGFYLDRCRQILLRRFARA